MPSFRITVTIGALRPGVAPQSVLPEAARAVRELATVEATDIGIVSGRPRITVRFTGEDRIFAERVGNRAVQAIFSLAEPLAATVTERVKGRWLPVNSRLLPPRA